MTKYFNRQEAGKILAGSLRAYANRKDVIVLALPRGGVPVAYEVAKALHAPLDVFIVRKLGVPGHSELAMGALAVNNVTVFNDEIVHSYQITQEEIDAVIAKETQELKRREKIYRGDQPFPSIANKVVILIDDGIATGATIRVAVKALRQFNPEEIVVAVPVADKLISQSMQLLADEFICPLQPNGLYAVGAWYDDFSQTEDEEVTRLLAAAK